jgi:hypothetical protein
MPSTIPYRTLGKTGESVSAIGLGGWHLGLPQVLPVGKRAGLFVNAACRGKNDSRRYKAKTRPSYPPYDERGHRLRGCGAADGNSPLRYTPHALTGEFTRQPETC